MRSMMIVALLSALAGTAAAAGFHLDASGSSLSAPEVQAKFSAAWKTCSEQGPRGARKGEAVLDCVARKLKDVNVKVVRD